MSSVLFSVCFPALSLTFRVSIPQLNFKIPSKSLEYFIFNFKFYVLRKLASYMDAHFVLRMMQLFYFEEMD